MKYLIGLVMAATLTGCAGMEYHPERVDWDGYQKGVQSMRGSSASGNGIERCQYWTDANNNVFKKCE
jgi:hypothetical protein